ncbi:phosphatase PAP2 family protein [Rhizobium sp. L1K21]|uniref:phosphatase PAP2 family protein n=1 Tax=Rhizobium sp. L1K21 TaxID=2954933 RepID=UPI0020939595|nr:phosphatase PAP2 family protein [Rhizobium sp. L1K21]MCO6187437.1 phosphatase PAP2 family protein [Rhizobium sp. L1K21]
MMADPVRNGLFSTLKARREQFAPSAPRIHWKTWLAITACLVVWAMVFRDVELTLAARQFPDWFRSIAEFMTGFGNSAWVLVPSALLFGVSLWLIKREQVSALREKAEYWAVASAYMFLSVALSGILGNILKRLFGRGRPRVFDEFGAFHFQPLAGSSAFESFPSGHSVTFGAMAMGFAVLFPRFRLPLLVIGFAFAMTRVFVGAHYLSDAIAGYSFGMWYAYMSAIFFAQYGYYVSRRGR